MRWGSEPDRIDPDEVSMSFSVHLRDLHRPHLPLPHLPARPHLRRAGPDEAVPGPDVPALLRAAEGPVLLASSSGGHLAELVMLLEQWGLAREDRHWVVPRTTQTEGALEGQQVTWVRPVESRQMGRAGLNLSTALAVHHHVRPGLVISAGAAQAVPHLVVAGLHRTPVAFVESVARLDGPSLTGRVAMRLPGAHLFAQTPGWGGRWQPTPDIYSRFRVVEATAPRVRRAVVALGTEHFGFVRAVDDARAVLGGCEEVTWQVGTTDYEVRGHQLTRWLPPDRLDAEMAASDVVVVHGGAGSVLAALRVGKVPVAVARTAARGEHCDDHQVRMCEALERRGLLVLVRPHEHLSQHHLRAAAAMRVVVEQPVTLQQAS